MKFLDNTSIIFFSRDKRYSPIHDASQALGTVFLAARRHSQTKRDYKKAHDELAPILQLLENAVKTPRTFPILASGSYPHPRRYAASRQAALDYLQNWCSAEVQQYICDLLPLSHPDRSVIMAKRLKKSFFMSDEQQIHQNSALHNARNLLEKAAHTSSPARCEQKLKYASAAKKLNGVIKYLESFAPTESCENPSLNDDAAVQAYISQWLPDYVLDYIELARQEHPLN